RRSQAVEHAVESLEGDRASPRVARARAVVEEEDVAGGQAPQQPRGDACRVRVYGVETPARPGDEPQGEAREHAVEPGIPDSDRRAEQARRAAGGGGDRVLGGADLALHRARAVEAEGMGMAEGVVLD